MASSQRPGNRTLVAKPGKFKSALTLVIFGFRVKECFQGSYKLSLSGKMGNKGPGSAENPRVQGEVSQTWKRF